MTSRISSWILGAAVISAATGALAAAPQKAAATGSPGSGYLEVRGHEYTPQGCTHNGNTTLCTFALVNRGNAGPVHAWPGDLRIVQLVDSSHVPHGANKGYFTDASGNHQAQLVLQPGDQGTLTIEFPNVGSDVTVSEFHLQSQIVAAGGGTATAAAGTAAAPATPAGTAGAAGTSGTAAATPAAAGSAAKPGTAASPAGGKPAAKSATPAAAAATAAPAASQPTACAANAKSPACRAALQQQQVCAKNATSKACENATARAEKLEAAAH